MNKVVNISDAINIIKDGDTIALGGNTLHRAPMALAREIVRQRKKKLNIIKTAGAHEVDLLVRGDCVESVTAGFISYETEFGLAMYYRKAVETGKVKANEHACYTVMCALNAGKINAPFMPVYGLKNSDLINANDYFRVINDPFTGDSITVVKAIKPDVALIHVSECDEHGNAIIDGPVYDDVLMSRASDKIIISTEKIISPSQIRLKQDRVVIPGFLVHGVVNIPRGAAPCSQPGKYDINKKILSDFINNKDNDGLMKYLNDYEYADKKMERKNAL